MKTKTKAFRSKKHLKEVSEMPCCVNDFSCGGEVQAHHLLKPWRGERGMGMKASDDNVIPLCQYHHSVLHDRVGNEFKFFVKYGRKETFGQELARKLYEEFEERNGSSAAL
tara:strand:- start:533 stop:865 length:333 start_codon:yes stop_codon:yes gene_type:complete